MITFHEIEEKHLQEVRGIYNDYVAKTTVSFDMDAASLDKMRELTTHQDPRFVSYVICQAEEIIGYILLSPFIKKHSCAKTAEITIYLKQDYIGQGIGGKAISFIEEQARERAFHTLIAVVCTENEGSLALFRARGYQLKGIIDQVAYKFDRFLDVAYLAKIL